MSTVRVQSVGLASVYGWVVQGLWMQVRRRDGDGGERGRGAEAQGAAHALPAHVPAPRHAAAARAARPRHPRRPHPRPVVPQTTMLRVE